MEGDGEVRGPTAKVGMRSWSCLDRFPQQRDGLVEVALPAGERGAGEQDQSEVGERGAGSRVLTLDHRSQGQIGFVEIASSAGVDPSGAKGMGEQQKPLG